MTTSAATPGLLDRAETVSEPMVRLEETGVSMFERFARDPGIDVDKLQKLMEMHERSQARFAQEQFSAAMAQAQSEMRAVAADATNPSTKSRYASYAALDHELRPIYTDHGFGLSFNTADSPLPEHVRVLCGVTHAGGHAKEYHIDMPADGKGAKGGDVMTKTHAVGSALSYGMRYLLKMVFNVAVSEGDDDGNAAGGKGDAAAPAGFDDWWADLVAVSDNGLSALESAWQSSWQTSRTNAKVKAFLDYATKYRGTAWNALKVKAGKVAAS